MHGKLAALLAVGFALGGAAPALAGEGAWHVISFDHAVSASDRASLDRAGAAAVEPWSRRSYAAFLDRRAAAVLRRTATVRRIGARGKAGVHAGIGVAAVVRHRAGRRALELVRNPDVGLIARDPSVLHVGRAPLGLLAEEEGGGQILAGNVAAGDKPKPGYGDWLKGVGADGTGVLISIVDSGVEEQHPDLEGQVAGKKDYTGAGDEGVDDAGHGTHVAGIVAGSGATADLFSDPDGLAYGLGVAPGAKLFDQNAVSFLAGGINQPAAPFALKDAIALLAKDAVDAGAVAWNASWQTGEGAGAGYVESARMVDLAVRDADPEKPGQQPLIMVFSAGNSGTLREERTLTAPHEAKNIIVVAASKMPRAGDPAEVADFSSRGPGKDGRMLPTVTAPGDLVVSTRAFAGPLCGTDPPVDPPAPPSPLHSACSGTSMASPHGAGAVALLTQWWRNFNGGSNPSPAMAKALLVNTAKDLGERDVPNIREGWGRIDTGALLAPGAERVYVDQAVTLSDPGEIQTLRVVAVDPSQPVRATLTWTDAPGAAREVDDEETSPPALVNDLDLGVSAPSGGYQGNRFEGGRSIPGGEEDRLNNVENVWLPAPGSGPITVSVKASALPGDGVPGAGDSTDQDYALVISNARLAPAAPAGTAAHAQPPFAAVRFKGRRIASLVVSGVPAGASVTVTCKGRCPKRGLRRSYAAAVARADLTRQVRKWRVRSVRVSVRAAEPGLSVTRTFRAPARRSAAR
jgi:hypothetical protein